MSINRVELTGNLTRDPVLRQATSGTSVLAMGLAVDERVRGETGEWEERPNFVDCVTFGRRAEGLSRVLRRGMKVAVAGRLHWSRWEDCRTHKTRSRIEVWVDELDIMSRRVPQDEDACAPDHVVNVALPDEGEGPRDDGQPMWPDDDRMSPYETN